MCYFLALVLPAVALVLPPPLVLTCRLAPLLLPLMAAMGLISLIFAAFMLYRRRDIKRLFAYSSIEHMGIIVFAFGMGGPLANFAGHSVSAARPFSHSPGNRSIR